MKIDLHLTKMKKAYTSIKKYHKTFIKNMENYSKNCQFYVDASVYNNSYYIAIVIPGYLKIPHNFSRCENNGRIYTLKNNDTVLHHVVTFILENKDNKISNAEILAIKIGIEISQLVTKNDILILSDSLYSTKKVHAENIDVNNHITLMWIPSHSAIYGNEVADLFVNVAKYT